MPWGFERAGNFPGLGKTRPPRLNRRVQQAVEAAEERFPEFRRLNAKAKEGYQWPGESPDHPVDELESLLVHADKYFRPSVHSEVPTERQRARILYECEQAYVSCVWDLPDDYDTRASFERAVMRLDMTSSPGYPYMKEHPTNRQWLGFNGVECNWVQLERLWYDVQLVFQRKFDHILRVFVKQEPHKIQKVLDNRWRLIMASPLCVQVAWHMMFDHLNDKEIQQSYYIPSQQGAVLVKGGWKQYREQWLQAGTVCGLDKSAWDWTAPIWAIELDLELRCRLGRGRRLVEWEQFAKHLYDSMFKDTYIMLSNGQLFKQIVPGIVKSGCVSTISINSHCQVFLHIQYSLSLGISIFPLPKCCGDDTLQAETHIFNLDVYERFGVIVKSVARSLEFMGHEITEDGPMPMYILKHLKKLQYVDENYLAEYLDSMARMYCHSRYFDFWSTVAQSLGYHLPLSRQAYLFWYDYGD